MASKRRQPKQKVVDAGTAEKPTQKKALAHAMRDLGPNASHAALARFVKQRFDMKLTVCISFPKPAPHRETHLDI